MNHALLPSVAKATLPVKYEAAKLALTECNRVDECKEWSDKMMALASYAKQAKDEELEKIAMRIRARAIRRCGVLLQEVENATGAHLKSGGAPTLSRKEAARRAGMSPDQQVTAIRVARVDGDLFEEQIESDEPPTITALAEQGTGKAKGVPIYVQQGMTKKAFQAGMYFREDLKHFIKQIEGYDYDDVIAGSLPEERDDIIRNISVISQHLNKILEML
jgi:hypothetical protein